MLTVKHLGQGPQIVLLHGFGLHSAILDNLAQRLSENFSVTLIDLPGYGCNHQHQHPNSLKALASAVSAVIDTKAIWIGWSLGGMVATYIAKHQPEQVNALIPLASNIQFTRTTSWPHAVSTEIMQSFAYNLGHYYQKTLKQFLALNCHYATNSRALIRQLSQALLKPAPTQQTLQAGLDIIIKQSIINLLPNINCPIHYILGEQDRLVPITIKEELLKSNSQVSVDIINKAGHAPFLSHPTAVINSINEFLACHNIP